jgi:hypothetical protein
LHCWTQDTKKSYDGLLSHSSRVFQDQVAIKYCTNKQRDYTTETLLSFYYHLME